MIKNMKRRQFFQTLVAATGVTVLFSFAAKAERKRGGSGAATTALALVDPKDAQAKAVSYGHKHSDIKDKAVQLERSGVKWADQKCSNCAFYQKDKEATISGLKAGGCAMPFATGKAVAADGWCTSWAKKA